MKKYKKILLGLTFIYALISSQLLTFLLITVNFLNENIISEYRIRATLTAERDFLLGEKKVLVIAYTKNKEAHEIKSSNKYGLETFYYYTQKQSLDGVFSFIYDDFEKAEAYVEAYNKKMEHLMEPELKE